MSCVCNFAPFKSRESFGLSHLEVQRENIYDFFCDIGPVEIEKPPIVSYGEKSVC